MDDILWPFTNSFVVIYLDDILIFIKSWEDHLQHLQRVFNTLWQHRLYANLDECSFGMTRVKYLGYIMDEHGVHAYPSKIQAIQDWTTTTTSIELRNFLGLANLYRKFMLEFSHIAWVLSQVSKGGGKDKFFWFDSQQIFCGTKASLMLNTHTLITRSPTYLRNWDRCLRLCSWCSPYSTWASRGIS